MLSFSVPRCASKEFQTPQTLRRAAHAESEARAHITISTGENAIAPDHHVRGTHDAIWKRMPAPVKVVESRSHSRSWPGGESSPFAAISFSRRTSQRCQSQRLGKNMPTIAVAKMLISPTTLFTVRPSVHAGNAQIESTSPIKPLVPAPRIAHSERGALPHITMTVPAERPRPG